MASAPSNFVWYELMTTDAPAARAFYQQVAGWTAADAGMPGYTLLSAGPHMVAGLMAQPPEAAAAGQPPGWLGFIAVADVDQTAAAVQADGGQVCHPPEDIPGIGRFATVADPHGAVFCLFTGSGGDEPPGPAPGSPGSVGWHELQAGPLDEAWAFYSRHFGWVKDTAVDMGAMGTYQLFASTPGAPAAGGMMTRPPEVPRAGWLFYINVPAIDAAAARVAEAGGQVVFGPSEVPGGSWIINAVDPQGMMFAMVAPQR